MKLERIKREIPIPDPAKRNVLVTSALPYVNNVPHLGNLIGSTLSSDVFARYARLRGYNTLLICGTDEHGTATCVKAKQEKKDPQEIVDYYHAIHKKIYEDFEIEFDHFGRTSAPVHHDIVQDIYRKVKAQGFFERKTISQLMCTNCNIALADRFIVGHCPHCNYEKAKGDQCDACGKLLCPEELVDAHCFVCDNPPEKIMTDHMFLTLDTLTPMLEKFINETSVIGKWTSNSTAISKSWMDKGLESRCMSRDIDWGVSVPEEGIEHKRFYVWFDAPIGYISITAELTPEWEKWWKNPEQVQLFQFMGKDNVPFHTVLFPGTLLGSGDKWTMLHHISTTEYLNYENGKFSKSEGRGIFGDHVAELPFLISCWRFYLLMNRPEQADSVFSWEDFQSKINTELLPKPGNLVQRVFSYIYKNCDKTVPTIEVDLLKEEDIALLEEVKESIIGYCDKFEVTKMRESLQIALVVCQKGNKYMQDCQVWDKSTPQDRKIVCLAVLACIIRIIACLFEPFMPGFSAIVYFFLGMERIPEDETFLQTLLATDAKQYVSLMRKGLCMNQPIPIFKSLDDTEVQRYRDRFA